MMRKDLSIYLYLICVFSLCWGSNLRCSFYVNFLTLLPIRIGNAVHSWFFHFYCKTCVCILFIVSIGIHKSFHKIVPLMIRIEYDFYNSFNNWYLRVTEMSYALKNFNSMTPTMKEQVDFV